MKSVLSALLLAPLLLLGCISMGGEALGNDSGAAGNNTTGTDPAMNNSGNAGAIDGAQNGSNETSIPPSPPPPKLYDRYTGNGFSFEYPVNMSVKSSPGQYGGIFTAASDIGGQTGEMVLATSVNTSAVYGKNKDLVFQADPTKAASDFLQQDKRGDPVGSILDQAFETGEIKTFGIARDGFAAQVPLKTRFGGSGKAFYGHAIDIYVPERSLLVKVRMLALDSEKADAIRDNFLLSFRLS